MSLDLFPDQPMINAQRFDLRPLRVSDTGQIALHSADLRIARMTSRIANPALAILAMLKPLAWRGAKMCRPGPIPSS